MRDEKEERKKQARSNKQTRQSNTAHPCIYKYKYVLYLHSGGKVVICAAVSLICWPCGRAAVSLICWALWSCDCKSDMLGFVAMWLSV